MKITLRAPIHKTLWFYSLCGLTAIALAFALFHLRVMQLKARERALKTLVNQRTAELQEEILVRKQAEHEAIRARDQLYFRATHDILTGIWNRGSILNFLTEEIDRGNRTGSPTGLLILDVDHFKSVNDTYGHLCGDFVLIEVVRRISYVIRQYDSVGRYGGEEFLVVLPDCDRFEALQSAERIRCAIEAEPIRFESAQIAVTVSIGVVSTAKIDEEQQRSLINNDPNRPRHEASMNELLISADAALYEAKSRGRNRSQLSESVLCVPGAQSAELCS